MFRDAADILQVLTPIFDPGFSESSFGFRPGRSAYDAAKQVQAHIRAGFRHCVDMDLSKFLDRVQHDVLMARVSRKVHDQRLLALIGGYLRAGVMVDTELQPSIEGTMQGGPLSPLLANILLDDFDGRCRPGRRLPQLGDTPSARCVSTRVPLLVWQDLDGGYTAAPVTRPQLPWQRTGSGVVFGPRSNYRDSGLAEIDSRPSRPLRLESTWPGVGTPRYVGCGP